MTQPRHILATHPSRGLRYHVVLLCLWEEPDGVNSSWRFSLESLEATDRRGFESLDALTRYLRGLMAAPGGSGQGSQTDSGGN